MPRATQSIRQWTILRLLETNRRVTLRQCAEALEHACHERTLRRDIEALELSGIPIYTERENGKRYWKLLDTYKRIPLPLTATELYALQCSRHLLAPLEGSFISESLESLFYKINAGLNPKDKAYLSLLSQTLQVGLPPYTIYKSHKKHIDAIKGAIEKGNSLEITYTPLKTGRAARRKIDPYRLWYYNGTLYLVGHCHKRKNLRTFVIDRIRKVVVMDVQFQIPLYFSIGDYFKNTFGVYRGEAETVTLRFKKPASVWVQSKQWHETQHLTLLKDGTVELKFQVAVTPELRQWVFGFGAQVVVIAPKRLKTMIENEAWRLLGQYQKVKIGRRNKILKKEKK